MRVYDGTRRRNDLAAFVMGCVAGDDTIIIVSRDDECATAIAERIRSLMKKL